MPNILVSTLGQTWAVGAELIAVSAFPQMQILENNISVRQFHQKHLNDTSSKIDEVWFICTQGEKTNEAIDNLNRWATHFPNIKQPEVKYLSLEKLEDLTNLEECNYMTDFIYRVVLQAKEYKKGGKLLLSLAGGRKTMSSDMQRAAEIFGCDVLFHLADNNYRINSIEEFASVLPYETANKIFLVEVLNEKDNHFITEIESALVSGDYPISFSRNNFFSTELFNETEKRLRQSESLLYNAYRIRTGETNQTIFHGLQQLPPTKLQKLSQEKPDYAWIKSLPKADLHFHFGGLLTPAEMIEVAITNHKEVNLYLDKDDSFNEWYMTISKAVVERNNELLLPYIKNKNLLRSGKFPLLPQPIVASAFLLVFEGQYKYLEQLIFGSYLNKELFQNIGIKSYEQLGDLQGSALMQSKASIEKSCDFLLEYCKGQNLKYLELRCSPCNYTHGGLTEWEVMQILHSKLANNTDCKIRIIIIGSRHGHEDVFDRHVELAIDMLKNNTYENFLVGFDIAGDESKKSPRQLRGKLLPLLEQCLQFTIHAGEDQPVENIWEAVYELNADRIGHGLTLPDNFELMKRFRDRNIFIELCPSSNFQIVDFRSKEKRYPLREFIDMGLKVTLNTDNIGISRTTITNEYLFMAQEIKLTKLEVLQLLRNSFQGTFLPKDEKKRLLIGVENELYNLISKED